MPAQQKFAQYGLEIILELFALYLAYRVNQLTGLKTAFMVFISASYLFYNIASIERIWNTSAMLVNPAKSAILITCIGVVYYGLQLLLTGLAFFLIGGAVGALVFSYWEIGS
jgi:isoprenylcysteine carboxyl methyltransferase (ICMT) family protein YpbQ